VGTIELTMFWFLSYPCCIWEFYIIRVAIKTCTSRRVWRYKRSNLNPYIDEEQKTQ